MSNIRRQSIISSLVIYAGFGIGLLNTYFFTKQGLFTEAEYGLTGSFIAISTMMMAFATLAMPSYIFKFFHYYNDHLTPRRNDLVTWALLVSSIGFVMVMIAGSVFKHIIIRKFGAHSPELLTYYYWIFPMGLGLTVYTVLEAYAWSLHKSVFTNFLKEMQWRFFTTVLIVLFIIKVIPDFDLFIKLYAFGYPVIAVTLLLYLLINGHIHITFSISKVTRRYFSKILKLCSFVYAGVLILTISQVFDSLVLASLDGLGVLAVYSLGQLMTSIIQAPQRGIISASISHLSKGWKEKNMELLQRVYQRSSLNLLIFSAGIFLLIWLNFTDAVNTFGLKPAYLQAVNVFFLIGLSRIVDMGTGVNAQIIATSNYWRFELVSGVILLVFMLPLTYMLTKTYGVIGPAIANLISMTIYNTIRIVFLWKKFRLFPFSKYSLYTLLWAGLSYAVCYFPFANMHGFTALVLRSITFISVYGAGVIGFKLSPDIMPVWETILKRLGKK